MGCLTFITYSSWILLPKVIQRVNALLVATPSALPSWALAGYCPAQVCVGGLQQMVRCGFSLLSVVLVFSCGWCKRHNLNFATWMHLLVDDSILVWISIRCHMHLKVHSDAFIIAAPLTPFSCPHHLEFDLVTTVTSVDLCSLSPHGWHERCVQVLWGLQSRLGPWILCHREANNRALVMLKLLCKQDSGPMILTPSATSTVDWNGRSHCNSIVVLCIQYVHKTDRGVTNKEIE